MREPSRNQGARPRPAKARKEDELTRANIARLAQWLRLGGGSEARLQPAESFVAIGDLHGCLRQMEAALDWAGRYDPAARIVILGDCVDRGPESAGVLRRLWDLSRHDPRLICLKGNHDAMLLDFLASPEEVGPSWTRARVGGAETLASFGLMLPQGEMAPADYAALGDRLRARMGAELIEWIASWPYRWRSGNIVAAHAGLDPALAPEVQNDPAVLWGNPRFLSRARRDGLIVVHGHYIVEAPAFRGGRIALDTGAYATGRLSAAHIAAGKVTFWTS